jgi:cytochrome o ubiquinol oxidase subunit 1
VLPQVERTDAFWAAKQQGATVAPPGSYTHIHVPRNNPTGFFTAFFAFVLGFGLIWHIWWMAILGLLGALAVFLVQAWRTDTEILIPVEEVAALERRKAA